MSWQEWMIVYGSTVGLIGFAVAVGTRVSRNRIVARALREHEARMHVGMVARRFVVDASLYAPNELTGALETNGVPRPGHAYSDDEPDLICEEVIGVFVSARRVDVTAWYRDRSRNHGAASDLGPDAVGESPMVVRTP